MTEFVIVYAQTVDETARRIPMILKNKPDYLKGVLNLPGGKLEPGECPIEAAVRELKEETGLEDLGVTDGMCPVGPEHMGIIRGNDCVIHCVMVPITHRQEIKPQEGETEVVEWFDADTLSQHPKLMPNLRLIIPLMQAGVKGWEITEDGNWRDDHHAVDLYLSVENNIGWEPLTVLVPGLSFYSAKEKNQ